MTCILLVLWEQLESCEYYTRQYPLYCKWYKPNLNLVQPQRNYWLYNQTIRKVGVELVSKMTRTGDLWSFSPHFFYILTTFSQIVLFCEMSKWLSYLIAPQAERKAGLFWVPVWNLEGWLWLAQVGTCGYSFSQSVWPGRWGSLIHLVSQNHPMTGVCIITRRGGSIDTALYYQWVPDSPSNYVNYRYK